MEFNLAAVHETMVNAIPDREALAFRELRFSHRELHDRARRVANYFRQRGLGVHTERDRLQPFESGQDHVALYLYNGNEYLEATFASWMARVAAVNVNYRYVEGELLHLFRDAGARAVVYHAEFAPRVAALREQLPALDVLIQVADDSGNPLLPGAVDYEEALAGASTARPDVQPSPDDLCIVYTGGTTGLPKGVLWRSADLFVAAMGGRTQPDREEFTSLDEIAAHVAATEPLRSLIGPPLMHSAAMWSSFIYMMRGACVVLPDVVKRFDPDDFLTKIAAEEITHTTIVGDAFAVPLLDQLERRHYDVSSLTYLANGGAPLSAAHKRRLLDWFPNADLVDGIGASETGGQAVIVADDASGRFRPNPEACVVSADRTRVLVPGDPEVGWLAQRGRVPLGYLGDPDATARAFPTLAGERYAVPGDRARHDADGTVEVLGRDSVTISSGGEKIFAEEVERALKHHPDVYDTVVAGRPSERWGEEVVAIVRVRAGTHPTSDDLLTEAAKHVARYKLPKAIVFCDEIVRSPSGKADYRWARQVASDA